MQVIFVSHLSTTLQSFDLNICSLGWMGTRLFIGQKDAVRCLGKQWMKVSRDALEKATPLERERIQERIEKYRQRGFKLLNADELIESDEMGGGPPAAPPQEEAES